MLEIKNINIDDLKPYKNNPRNNIEAVKYVKNSIQEFGFKVPIIIDKDNTIITGHTRYKAAKELKITEIPCIIADDLTEVQIKAFRLVDNKVSEKSEWDFELLDKELEDILDIDISEFGFSDIEEINFDNVKDLQEETYEEPKKETLCCPNCGHIDTKVYFKKVD